MQYAIVDGGRDVGRASAEMNYLAKAFGLVMNRDLLDGLHSCLGFMSTVLLVWLDAMTGDRAPRSGQSMHR